VLSGKENGDPSNLVRQLSELKFAVIYHRGVQHEGTTQRHVGRAGDFEMATSMNPKSQPEFVLTSYHHDIKQDANTFEILSGSWLTRFSRSFDLLTWPACNQERRKGRSVQIDPKVKICHL
jgi:hypothetical protein